MTHSTAYGTAGGTILALITVNANTIIATVIVAVVGATASFFTSLFFKWLVSSDEDRAKIQNAFKRIRRKK